MAAIVGMALFTQYYYWFPMIHFINLAVEPEMLFGVDSNLKIVKNFQVKSKSKPSLYGYPSETKFEEKSLEKKVATAVLSTVGRAKAKSKRLGTATSINQEMNIDERSVSTNLMQNLVENKEIKEEKPVEEVKEKVEEANEDFLENPCRILTKQIGVIEFINNQDFQTLLNNRFNGFLLLNKTNSRGETVYFEEEVKVEEKKEEDMKVSAAGENVYQPIPTQDIDMPEEIDLNALNKK